MKILKRIWNNPVWSKVIAAGIIAILALVPISIWWNIILMFLVTKIEIWMYLLILFFLCGLYFGIDINLKKRSNQQAKNAIIIYCDLLNSISNFIMLEYWDVFIDNAMRGIVIEEFIDNQRDFNLLILSTIWPNKWKKIKKRILIMNIEYNDYVSTFLQHADLIGNSYKEIKYYQTGVFNPKYDEMLDDYKKWALEWYKKLNNFVFSLNNLIETSITVLPIENLKQSLRKKYMLEDTMGVYNKLQPTITLPHKKYSTRR